MATPAEVEQQLAAARATLGQLEANQGAVLREVGALNAEARALRAESNKLYQGGDQAGAKLLREQEGALEDKAYALSTGPAAQALAAEQAKIRTLENDLYRAQQKAEFDAKQASGPTATAEVKESADGATQNPAPAPASTGRLTTTEAATLAQNTEYGTNPPVKTLTETQSVINTRGLPVYNEEGTLATSRRNPETGELYTPLNSEGRPGGAPGVGATGEDGVTAANTKQIISAAQANQSTFTPRNNVLDQYASYTYNIGWYLMTPEQYTTLQKTSKIAVSQYNLLIQSGGAPSTVEGVQPDLTSSGAVAGVSKSAGRNPFFGLDYYFDNFVLKSKITGKGSGLAHNAVELSFTVTETANITLINNLAQAVTTLYKNDSIKPISAYFALVIRFYGYDENGKIVQASDSDNKSAVVEKIIPFRLKDIQFSVSNKLVEYQIQAQPVPYQVGLGSSLGVVKSSIQISGGTVKDLLTKGVALAEVSPADGRKTTPTPAKPAAPAPLATAAVNDTSVNAGVDANGNFTGDTANPNAVVAP